MVIHTVVLLASVAMLEGTPIIEATGVKGGLVVHLACGDGRLTASLLANDRYVVQGLDSNWANVKKAREHIQSLGHYGKISIDHFDGTRLPYADHLVNLVVAEDLGDVSKAEVLRVLAPDGVAYLKEGRDWKKTVKPRPKTIDEWTHYLHDASGNAVAADSEVGPPKSVRWIAGPLWGRSHEFNPSINALVVGGGRMFYTLDEGVAGIPDVRFPARWSLCGRDAFSGVLLWKQPLPNWGYREWNTVGMWSAPLTLQRRLVTDGERVFVTLGYKAPVSVLDAATGETLSTFPATLGTDEIVLIDGTLLLCVRKNLSVAAPPKKKSKRRLNPHEWSIGPPGAAAIVALDAGSGQVQWRLDPQPVTLLTLAARGNRVCFHGASGINCLDLKTGKQLWATDSPRMKESRHSGGTLVLHDDTVLFTSAEGLTAFAVDNGKRLWSGPRVRGPGVTHPPDLFVADGLVWGGDEPGTHSRGRTTVRREGRDPVTGEVKRTVEVKHLISPLHHFRCYRSKATDRYLLLPKRGIEFLDLQRDDHMRHDWLRPTCHYGVVPSNGLLYVPPHHCFCYPGVKVNGFLALSSAQTRKQPSPPAGRLQSIAGVKKNSQARSASSDEDWPTYRHDPARSGHTETAVPTPLKQMWRTQLGGKITPPVLAGGKIYLAQVNKHRVCCLDGQDGQLVWTFTAGGRVDSPPTIYRGLALFGCRDGWVYCVQATDGKLLWRFRVAPEDRRVVVLDQLESPWPAHGSVLVLGDVAYVTAGRSSYLDGGIDLFGLKPESGELVCQTHVEGPRPDVNKDVGRPFDMEGVKSDILVSDGNRIFLYQMAFDTQLRKIKTPRASNLGNRKLGRHLVATGGFLEDIWYDRTYWTYSDQWPGFYYSNAASKSGQILVFDETTTYGLHVFTERARLSPRYTPGTGCKLFADDNENDPILKPNSVNREKGPGFARQTPPKWSTEIPLRALSMVLAHDKLFLAGPPDVVPKEDPYATFDGRMGAELWVVSCADGKKLANYPLKNLPLFDGLIACGGRLYLSMEDGAVLCFGKP